MVIKYCKNCSGKPYTTDLNQSTCPRCGSNLRMESIDEAELFERDVLMESIPSSEPYEEPYEEPNQDPYENYSDDDTTPRSNRELDHRRWGALGRGFHASNRSSKTHVKSTVGTRISGKLTRYSVTDSEKGYKRLFITKVIDALIYHQRMDDVLHRFTVRVDQDKDAFGYSNFKDVPVNVHGVIAGGAQLDENADVEVTGTFKNNVLMARSIDIINSGYRSRVKFQRSRQGILYGVLAAIALFFLIYVGASSNGGFFQNIGSFFVAWLISAAIVTVLYLALFMSRFGFLLAIRRKGFPFIGILLISFILALLYMNMFGLGTGVGGLLSKALSSILPIIIVIIVIVFVIRLIFRR